MLVSASLASAFGAAATLLRPSADLNGKINYVANLKECYFFYSIKIEITEEIRSWYMLLFWSYSKAFHWMIEAGILIFSVHLFTL